MTNKIKPGSSVKFTADNREYVGLVLGIVPAGKAVKLSMCGDVADLAREHQICIATNGEMMNANARVTYLVSIKAERARRPRVLYRRAVVELCATGDERDGVYPVQ